MMVKHRQFSDICRRVQRMEKDTEFLLEEINLIKARLSKVEHLAKHIVDHLGGVSGE